MKRLEQTLSHARPAPALDRSLAGGEAQHATLAPGEREQPLQLAVEVGGILARALNRWGALMNGWRETDADRALAAVATQLVELAEQLLDALASCQGPDESAPLATTVNRSGHSTH